jgi:alkylation response protein AidB-like acyl-CoA dehydrogenase
MLAKSLFNKTTKAIF